MTIQFRSAATQTNRLGHLRGTGLSALHACARLALGLLLVLFASVGSSRAQYADLYDFPGGSGPCCPQQPSVMAQGRDGFLYGITSFGGTNNIGTVYKISPKGVFTLLYNFDGTHGSTPVGGLTLGLDGLIYGTTEEGGAHGFGNIFKVTSAGVLTVIYDFKGTTDGGLPVSALIVGADGNLYSTTHPGILYKVTPAGVFTVVAKTPTESFGPLLLVGNSYYGVTEFGGTNTLGTIYKVTGATSTTLYTFDGPHGEFPIGGLVEGLDGNLYGTTTAGGSANDGVIFRITPTGTYSVVFNFDHLNSLLLGYQAFAGLIVGSDGNLYGSTIWGGTNGYGVIFQLTYSGAYSVLYNFAAITGDGAYATPLEHTNGSMFGLLKRGSAIGDGVIYSFTSGLPPYIALTNYTTSVGKTIGIAGNGLSGATSVMFNGTPTSFHVLSNTYMTVVVPSGETGFVSVNTATGTLTSSRIVRVTPKVTGFSPTSGKVGDSIVLTGTGLIQALTIAVGGVKATSFTVNSDLQVTFKVPTGAKTGKISVTTPGGAASSSTSFTVTP